MAKIFLKVLPMITESHEISLLASSLFSSVDALNKWTCSVCLLTLLSTYKKLLGLAKSQIMIQLTGRIMIKGFVVHFEGLLKYFGLVF